MLDFELSNTSFLRLVRTCVFFTVIFLPLLGFSQKMRFDHLSVKQGLSQGNVNDLLQDKFGFIWIATEDGLNLYDGYKVTVFRTNPDDSTSLSSNSIHCLEQDNLGNIWIGTSGGLNLYNRALNRFDHFKGTADERQYLGGNIGAICIENEKQLWFSAFGGVILYDAEKKTFKRFNHDPANPKSLPNGNVDDIMKDASDRLWFGINGGGLSMLNPDGETFTNYAADAANPDALSDNTIKCLFEDREKKIWIGTSYGGMNQFDPDTKKFKRFVHDSNNPASIASQLIRGITEDKLGRIWVSTDGALDILDRNTGIFTHSFNEPNDEKSISSNITVKVIFDSDERAWIGTRYGGVNIYDRDRYLFELYKHNPLDKTSLSNNNTTALAEDGSGIIWIGTDGGGVNYFNRKTGIFTSIEHNPANANSPTNNKTLAVCVDKNGGVWTGMWEGGVNYYNPATKTFKHYMPVANDPRSVSDSRIFKLFCDRKGTVWVGDFEMGLNRYNPATDDFTRYMSNPDDPTSIVRSAINDIVDDDLGNIWVATSGGLNMLDVAKGTFLRYEAGPNPGSMSSNSTLSLLFDSQKRLWVGTDGGGLNLFDRESKTFKVFTKRDGLPNDAIMGILEGKDHNIWVSTNQGLSRFDPDKITFKNYDDSYGLQDNQFGRWAYVALSTGELIFGGANGFNLFNPQNIRDNPFKPRVYITDFKLFNKPIPIGEKEILKQNIMLTKEISVPYSQNFFTFEFTALNYRQTEKNQYKYIMEGFQDEWIDAGTERKVSYTNLSPGKYVFKVIASNNDGVWNKEGASVQITIVPPFWRTYWFIGLVTILIGSGIFGFVRYQRKKTIRQKEELKAIIEERTSEVLKQNEEILKRNEAEKIQNWITQGLAHIGEIMSKHKDNLEELSTEILIHLVKYVNAQQGSLAIAVKDNPQDEHLKLMSTYAANETRLKLKRIEIGEGLIGATYKEQEKKYITKLPSNYLKLESGLGETTDAKLVLFPLKTDSDINGVIELAFFEDVSEVIQEFLDKVAKVIALNISSASLNHKTHLLLQQSKEQTEELRAQEEEMRQNMEEMEATQEELRRREESTQRKMMEFETLEQEFKRKEQAYLDKIEDLEKNVKS